MDRIAVQRLKHSQAEFEQRMRQKLQIDADAMMAQARKDTGLDDFGDPHFIEPLRLLVRSTNEEADQKATDEGADDADQDGDDNAARIPAGHDELGQNAGNEPYDNPA